jgi:hypothetical protein
MCVDRRDRGAARSATRSIEMRFNNFRHVQQLRAGAATVVTLSLAVTFRVERSCSEESPPRPNATPSVLYSYPEILFANSTAQTGWLAFHFRATHFGDPELGMANVLTRE